MDGAVAAFYILGALLAVTTGVTIYNFFTAPRLLDIPHPLTTEPFVSILVPARNEEQNISRCLKSILAQSYENCEVLVLDDRSEDRTPEIVKALANDDGRVTLLNGNSLPSGWLGKNWACFQLSERARGEVLLFVDADVTLSPHALRSGLHMMESNGVEMLSCFPKQEMASLGEWLVVPLMNWFLLSFLPLTKVHSSPRPSFVAACGQFILCRRQAYKKIGGHRAVADQVVEDMELARRLKEEGYPIMAALSRDCATCKMYGGFMDAFRGFSKNFFPGFNVSPSLFVLVLLLFLAMFLLPIVLTFLHAYFLWLIFAIALGRILSSILSSQNVLLNVALHPLQIIILAAIGVSSTYTTLSGKVEWKGRRV
jgi:chlorobactene glucosyltransferase